VNYLILADLGIWSDGLFCMFDGCTFRYQWLGVLFLRFILVDTLHFGMLTCMATWSCDIIGL
jgi:hypothetical protein